MANKWSSFLRKFRSATDGICFLVIAILLIGSISVSRVSAGSTHGTALIMSSLDNIEPFGYYGATIAEGLQAIGYSVTVLKDTQVTVGLLMSGLNNYNIIIWRTDTYQWAHRTYWYVGQIATPTALSEYAGDFADNVLDGHAGTIGASLTFFQKYFSTGSLSNVRLAFLLFSISDSIASAFIQAGAESVIFCVSSISLQFGVVDDLAAQVVAYLTAGDTLQEAVWTTISPYLSNIPPEDPLDSTYAPPFWYLGDGSLTIT